MSAARVLTAVGMFVVFLMGAGAFFGGARLILEGAPNLGGAITGVVMGIVLTGVSLAYCYMQIFRAPLEARRLMHIRTRYPGQPWMERSDWASRKLTSSTGMAANLMWVWAAGWWGFLIFIATVNREKILKALAESWWNGAFIAILVGAGLAGLWVAIVFTRNTRRYGVSTLDLDTFPAFLGEPFSATLTARLSPTPQSPLDVELVCEGMEWVTIGYGDRRRSRLDVTRLGIASARADARMFSPSASGLRGRIEIDVPMGLPVSSRDDQGNGVRWSLRIATTGKDDPFSCGFEIPVFDRHP